MNDLSQSPREQVQEPRHPMSFSELMSLGIALNGRLDGLWQRVLYAHAAIVGVMVFFATADYVFAIPRVLVFFFYTLNTGITIFAFRETYAGLSAATRDLQAFPQGDGGSHLQLWLTGRNYDKHSARRVFALIVVWIVVGYLLVFPLFSPAASL